MKKFMLPLLAIVAMASCDLPLGACSDEAVPGIAVTLLDSVTSARATGEQILVIATDGGVADTARHTNEIPWFLDIVGLVYENPGSYRVEVFVTGYRPWMKERVRVSRNACHVETVRLTARLQRP